MKAGKGEMKDKVGVRILDRRGQGRPYQEGSFEVKI